MRYLNLVDRLLSNCIAVACKILPTQCWQSTYSVCNKGYAQCSVRIDGKPRCRRAHIMFWELVNKRKVRDGYTLDHLCMNKRCIRPDHLEEVTRSVNTARMRAHYRRLSAQARGKPRRRRKSARGAPTAHTAIAGTTAKRAAAATRQQGMSDARS